MSKKIIFFSLIISLVYFVLIIYSFNSQLVLNTLSGDYPLSYKVGLMTALLGGLEANMTSMGLLVLILISILTGLDLALAFKTVRGLGKSKLSIVGGSLLGIVSSGCAACGLPLLSIFGLSGSLAYLPFRGAELSFIALGLLLLSFILLLKQSRAQSCLLE